MGVLHIAHVNITQRVINYDSESDYVLKRLISVRDKIDYSAACTDVDEEKYTRAKSTLKPVKSNGLG